MARTVEAGSAEAHDLLEAYELLSAYVSHGAMDADDQFDGWFEKLAELVPRRLVRPVSHVHRTVIIPARDLAAIRAGGRVTLRPRAFGSWSRSRDAAFRCLRGRFARMGGDMAAIIVTKPVTRERVVVDVQEVYGALAFDVDGVEDWERYASWEEEVIVRQDASMLSISAADVTVAHLHGDPEALRPLAGERAWSERDGDMLGIEHVDRHQPGAAEGVWDVEVAGRGGATLAWDGRADAWEVTAFRPGEEPGDDEGPDGEGRSPSFG